MLEWIALAAATALSPDPTIDDVVQKGFRDASFVARVVKADFRELGKINKDFGQSYKVDMIRVFVKEPLKLRLESKVDDTEVQYVLNGFKRIFRIPRARLSKSEDLSDSPGKVQTLFDFGILTPSLVDSFFDAKFVRVDRASGDYVFDVGYDKARFDDKTRYRIWVDPQKRYTTKREWFHKSGRHAATFYYENPTTINGATLPQRVTVKNVDNKIAAITEYSSPKVNAGLSDSLFKVE